MKKRDFQRFLIFQQIRSHGGHLGWGDRSPATLLGDNHSLRFGAILPCGTWEDENVKSKRVADNWKQIMDDGP